ncbi:MAG: hypothetical protein J6T34_01270 [Bacilli bacterium]|nr:hypothetical protein [Bacilli bacterium]
MYAKLIDNYLNYPPRVFYEGDQQIVGFTDSFLKERGYKPVVYQAYPDDENEYEEVYTEKEDVIEVRYVLLQRESNILFI